jgi:uncharacterized repeat protein (TIGR01451 family)
VAQALASPGEVVPYELTWMNTGGALACDVQLEIPIPSGTRVVRTWPELALDGDANHVTWQLGDVEAGARGVVQLALRMESSRAGDTEVTLRPRLYGAELPALEDTVSVVVHAAPVLRARITVDERTVRPGALLTYRIHVANQGDGDASDLLLRLPLPERTDVVSVGGGQGTLDADARELNVPLGDLAPGESNDVELKVRLDSTFPSGESLLSLQAYFDSTGLDTTVTSEPIETIVTAVSDLAVSLTFGCTTARPGEEIEGLLQVVNRGNADVSRLLLHLHLPEGCTVVSADEGTGHPLAWEGLTLAAGQEAQRCVRFQLPQSFKAGTSELQMKAEAIPYGEEPFTVSAVLWVQATSDLRIELQALPGETRPGAEIKLRALVENHGDAPAEGVNASIWLPERLDLVGFEPEGLWDQVARRVHWTLGSVEPAGQVSCCALVRVSEAFPAGSSTLPVRASVEADHALATEDALTQIQVTAKAQLEANAEISVQSASPGDRVLIRVAWENVGDAPAHGARLFVQAAPNTRLDVDPVRLDLGTVPPGATGTLEIPVQLLKAFPAGVTNASPTITLGAGSLKGQALEVPSLMVTAASNIRVDVSSETSVAMASVESRVATQTSDGDDNEQAAQTQSEPMPVGADLKFTLTIVNKGNAPAQDTTITHDLPPGATFITASHGGRYVAASHAVVWELGTVRVDTPAVRTTVVRFGG